jgi:hypothetical protein
LNRGGVASGYTVRGAVTGLTISDAIRLLLVRVADERRLPLVPMSICSMIERSDLSGAYSGDRFVLGLPALDSTRRRKARDAKITEKEQHCASREAHEFLFFATFVRPCLAFFVFNPKPAAPHGRRDSAARLSCRH